MLINSSIDVSAPSVLVPDPSVIAPLLEQRRRCGGDRYDEVWDGVYVMHALPNDEHQKIVSRLDHALVEAIEDAGLGEVRPGVNLASDAADWERNYRCPDVVVFLRGSGAECHGAFWTGGPDLAVEILSPRDETPSKIGFYATVGTRELLVIDRDPWRLDLHRHDGNGLPVAATGGLDGETIESQSLPITLRLVSGDERPRILVTHAETGREWTV